MEAKPIYDLGVETSIRWAQDQKYLDKSIIEESRFVTKQARIDVSLPFFKSEFDLLFQLKKRYRQWADFLPPKGFYEQRMRIFTFQVAPSLGSEDLQQVQLGKIKEKLTDEKKKREEKKAQGEGAEYPWQEEREDRDEEKEAETLVDLLEYIIKMDKLLMDIQSKRSQYSKG
ncbi:MAG: DUF5399 family protein [Simkania negevensis]|nr:DUF5399 family protein [Simkania negevensis]